MVNLKQVVEAYADSWWVLLGLSVIIMLVMAFFHAYFDSDGDSNG